MDIEEQPEVCAELAVAVVVAALDGGRGAADNFDKSRKKR